MKPVCAVEFAWTEWRGIVYRVRDDDGHCMEWRLINEEKQLILHCLHRHDRVESCVVAMKEWVDRIAGGTHVALIENCQN